MKNLKSVSIIWMLVFSHFLLNAQNEKSAFDLITSNLPIVVIETEGLTIPGDPKIEAHMGIINNPGSENNINDPCNNYDGIIGIETRGSSSSGWPKKSYSFETRNSDETNLNVELLGMPEENDWVLNGPYSDKSLMRNVLAYHLAGETGRWAPRTRFCELVLNNDYQGVYVMMEKIKRDGDRVDIATLNPDEISGDDLTGGYIIKIDRPDEHWTSQYYSPVGSRPIYFSYVYPDPDEMPDQQKNYIKDYVNAFEDALAGDNFINPDLGYRRYVNTESFMDFFLINELSRNVDAYRLSTFLYKDRDSRGGKLTMGPIWDFNLAFGNADYYDAFEPEGWMLHTVPEYDGYQAPFWWDRLREDPYYNAALKARWEFLRGNTFSEKHIVGIIDSLSTLLTDAQVRNFETFPILGAYVWPNYFIGDTYESEIQFMKDWISSRIDWMDDQLSSIDESRDEILPVNSWEISFYPNPFMDLVTIRYYALQSCNLSILITDAMGRQVYRNECYTLPGYNEIPLNLGNLVIPPGIYLCQIMTDGKLIRTEKLIRD